MKFLTNMAVIQIYKLSYCRLFEHLSNLCGIYEISNKLTKRIKESGIMSHRFVSEHLQLPSKNTFVFPTISCTCFLANKLL
jgi:hypothetical protein